MCVVLDLLSPPANAENLFSQCRVCHGGSLDPASTAYWNYLQHFIPQKSSVVAVQPCYRPSVRPIPLVHDNLNQMNVLHEYCECALQLECAAILDIIKILKI